MATSESSGHGGRRRPSRRLPLRRRRTSSWRVSTLGTLCILAIGSPLRSDAVAASFVPSSRPSRQTERVVVALGGGGGPKLRPRAAELALRSAIADVDESQPRWPPSLPIIRGAISTKISDLSPVLGGSGRAKLCWDCYKLGVDPSLYFAPSPSPSSSSSDRRDYYEDVDASLIFDALITDPDRRRAYEESMDRNGPNWRAGMISSDIEDSLPTLRRGQKLGGEAVRLLSLTYGFGGGGRDNGGLLGSDADNITTEGGGGAGGRIEGDVAALSHLTVSSDGTAKLLLRLRDGLEVETVIIPWYFPEENHSKSYSTLCISSQVGCRQGCTFCATGRMGRIRNLTSDEILAQFFYAAKVCRLGRTLAKMGLRGDGDDSGADGADPLPEITNAVFMGMGEPADNAREVNAALSILTDVEHYRLSPSKVTVSTVAPSPDAFVSFSDSPCVLAWSVHAADDDLRRVLVPTTRYTMEELRVGLVEALLERPASGGGGRLRDAMLEVALIDGVNDSVERADELADLALRIAEDVGPGMKLLVNLLLVNRSSGLSAAERGDGEGVPGAAVGEGRLRSR